MSKKKEFRFKREVRVTWAVLFVILTIAFLWVNLPFLYAQNQPEAFGFFSNANSYNNDLKYDSCSLEAINDSVSGTAYFYFGYTSKQLINVGENQSNNFVYVYWGNSGHVKEFNDSLLNNNIPDYLAVFPFDIDNIGRSYRMKMYPVNGTFQSVNLTTWSASHFNGENNTLIAQLTEPPTIYEFKFTSSNVFSQISYDTKALNVYISDELMWDTPQLINNLPASFNLTLKIPKNYQIQDIDKYHIIDTQDTTCTTITIDLVKQETVDLIIIDPLKTFEKTVIDDLFWAILVGGIIAAIIYEKFLK
jgi:hypothetical protein